MAEKPLYFENPVGELQKLFLWPYSGCNCRCVMCDIWQDKSRQEISVSDVRDSVAGWRDLGVRTVVLTGGEAIMHKDIWQIAEVLTEHDMTVQLVSTGMTLWRHAENVVRYCADVTFSIDGPREVHNLIRRVPRSAMMLERSVGALREQREDYPIRGRSTVHRRNYRFLPETVRFAQEIGMSKISFIGADVDSEAFNRPGGWDEERQEDIALGPADLPLLEEELDRLERECGDEFASGYISKSPEVVRRKLLDYYRALHGLNDFPHFDCNAPWKSAVVEPDGTVRPCFYQPPYEGNLREPGGLLQILNSPSAVAFRESLDTRTDPTCVRCTCRFALHGCNCSVHTLDG
jgi:Fe-coproporphyrin III synthase